jgi:hypothetical protein
VDFFFADSLPRRVELKRNKRYRIFHVPVLAFFSRALYRDVALNWKGTAFGYLLLLLALCWIPGIVILHRGVAEFVDLEAPKLVSQLPEITITNGELSIDEPEPYTISDPDTGEVVVVFDTTGTITSLEEAEALGLVTRTQVTFQKNAFETRTFNFSEVDSFVLTQDRIYGWLDAGKRFAAPVLYPLCVLGAFVYRVLQALLYAAIGLLIARILKAERSYDELLRLAVVAVTPAILVATLLDGASITLPFGGLWYFLATMGYLAFGIKAAGPGGEPDFQFSNSPGNES